MCGYQPKYSLSSKGVNLISEISSLVALLDSNGAKFDPKLRKKNRVRAIQSSLQIEANSMTVKQVTDIMDGKRVLSPPREILEVQNAIRAYEMIPELDPYSVKDLLRLHGTMMSGLVEEPGAFRTAGVNVVNGGTGEVIHYAPHPDFVPRFIEELMEWASAAEDHPLIVSSVFHHEFEYIHPFRDGNGRTGGLWQNLILYRWNSIFEWIPIESAIRGRQNEYYDAIREATDSNNSSVFIDFMLESIRDALKEINEVHSGNIEDIVLSMISSGSFTNANDTALELGVSERTVRRAISSLKGRGAIRREGSDKNGVWMPKE